VPPARKHEARPRKRVVEHRLGRARRVAVDTSRNEHDEHPVAPRDRPLYDLGVIRCSWSDRDAPLERVELPNALLPAHANDLVAPIERLLHHVLPELPGGADDANPHLARAHTSKLTRVVARCTTVEPSDHSPQTRGRRVSVVMGRNYPRDDIVDVTRCLETQQTSNVVLTVSDDHKT